MYRRCYWEIRANKVGLGTAQLKYWQAIAAKDGVPIWLEATTKHSRDVYAKSGFELVDSIPLGKGKSDEHGVKKEGGEGFEIYAMIWWPPKIAENGKSLGSTQ